MLPLAGWENYYVIVGSSAAALTGLQFVVIALIADSGRKGGGREIAAFGTPTIVHFGAALLVSAIASAPWPSLAGLAWAIGLTATAGLLYAAITIARASRQQGYAPVFEDWLFHAALPVVSHGMMLASALALRARPTAALFAIAGAVMLLVVIGIHNAWDTVTFIVLERMNPSRSQGAATGPAPSPSAPFSPADDAIPPTE